MYAIVKTGGKQYKVEPGTVVSIEKLDAEIGDEVELPVIFFADGDSIEADPEKAAATKVTAEVLDQYKGKKQLVFKFKKRKGYKKLKGHRQQLTKVRILSVGDAKWEKKAAFAPEADEAEQPEAVPEVETEQVEAEAVVEPEAVVEAEQAEAAAEPEADTAASEE